MNKILITVFILLMNFTLLKAEIVNKFNISGNKRISNETIKIYGNLELNKNYKENDLNIILQNLYKTNFFENIDIEIVRIR